jgi:hypothetical protein
MNTYRNNKKNDISLEGNEKKELSKRNSEYRFDKEN